MFYILEIIQKVLMTVVSLIVIALGIAIWWTANIFIVKLVASASSILVGAMLMCMAIIAWCDM